MCQRGGLRRVQGFLAASAAGTLSWLVHEASLCQAQWSVGRRGMFARNRLERGVAVPGFLAAITAGALAAYYLFLISTQGFYDLSNPRVLFVFAYTMALGLACALGVASPWRALSDTLITGAATGFALIGLLAGFSIGVFYLVPLFCAGLASLRLAPRRPGRWSLVFPGTGMLAAGLILVSGIILTPTG